MAARRLSSTRAFKNVAARGSGASRTVAELPDRAREADIEPGSARTGTPQAERLAEEKRQRQIEGGGGNGRNRGNGGNEDGGGDDDPEPPEPKPTPKPTPRKPRPRALLFKRFRDIDPTARKLWLLKGLIAAGELGYLVRPPGSLKHPLKVEMHVHLVRGEDWRGHRNKAGPCATVYFALERGDLVERRLAAYRERLTGPDGIVPDLPIVVVSRLINLMEPACVQVIVDTILDVQDEYGLPVRMATIDTVPKGISAGGGDENTAKDKGTAMANLRKIQDILTEVDLDLVGHSGKDETKGSRGSNTDVADADLLVQISTDGETRTATVIKANDRAEGPLFAFTGINHSFGEDEYGDPVAVHIIDPDAHVTQTPSRGGKPPRLTDAAKIALKALKKAIAETGQIPPSAITFRMMPCAPPKSRGGATPTRWISARVRTAPSRRLSAEPRRSSKPPTSSKSGANTSGSNDPSQSR